MERTSIKNAADSRIQALRDPEPVAIYVLLERYLDRPRHQSRIPNCKTDRVTPVLQSSVSFKVCAIASLQIEFPHVAYF